MISFAYYDTKILCLIGSGNTKSFFLIF